MKSGFLKMKVKVRAYVRRSRRNDVLRKKCGCVALWLRHSLPASANKKPPQDRPSEHICHELTSNTNEPALV